MKYLIEITCNNSAFYNPDGEHDPCAEVASVLERLCTDVLRMGDTTPKKLFDTYGNHVGTAHFKV